MYRASAQAGARFVFTRAAIQDYVLFNRCKLSNFVLMTDKIINIAVFASGNGSNAENIVRKLNVPGSRVRVSLVVSSKADAGVVSRARSLGVPVEVIAKAMFDDGAATMAVLEKYNTDAIVLAGFLLMVPSYLVRRYRIVNIHPSLLPKFGGKGMYGGNVHRAVVEAGESETGITIHYVTEEYDKGEIIFQASAAVSPNDTPLSVEQKVHELEYRYFPEVIARIFAG